MTRDEALQRLKDVGVDLIERWANQGWQVGQYELTENFKKFGNHSCVCTPDLGIVAVFGDAAEIEFQQQAELFAAAPNMLKALMEAEDKMQRNGWALEVSPYPETLKMIQATIKAAKGGM